MKALIRRLRPDPYFVAGVLAVVVIGAVYRVQASPARAGELPVSTISSEFIRGLDLLGAGRTQGSADAPVKVIELFDYQCPACAAAHEAVWPSVARLIERGAVQYTAYDLPLPGHANAIPASVVANCVAERVPEHFAEVRRRLFATQAAWSEAYPAEPALLEVVAAAGADSAAVRECAGATGSSRAAVYRKTWEAARTAGVTFTPAWAVNGKVVKWADLEAEVEAAVRRAGSAAE
ncbi:thioredoxin domain-containing protein [Longimicrobium sp.]|uniref:thioredoxin domain-containing protein n=1 Tax=Longimicrobium sp. TaxID=2029185 RepID=UPI002E3631EB|nr:thioredoxin domain-containing protein [Longimicrobium sp.]HEX6038601.1 thioredoxin domain-containing protein [Longimicrobium sp.]